jgi:phosphatidylserine/phosphatidylglycerophosphate/cardiolipin synthase-like enzyme
MRRKWLTIGVGTCAFLLTTASGADRAAPRATPALAGEYPPSFNIPKQGHQATTLQNKLLAYIKGAVPGSKIRGHITTIGIKDITKALIEAHERGVSVYLVHDGRFSPNGSAPERGDHAQGMKLEAHLGARHVWCYQDQHPAGPGPLDPTSCVSTVAGATHHIKNWYFSNTVVDGRRREYSTWVTSYNLTHSSNRQFNDAFVVNGNRDLYRAYVRSFERFYNQARSDDFYNVPGRGHQVIPSAKTEIAYSPQKAGDQVAAALSRIDRYERRCRLRVANLSIAASRTALIGQLVRIESLGCRVQVAVSCDHGAVSQLLPRGIKVRTPKATQIHSKMMLYRGRYDGQPNRRLVWGGSHNLTGPSLRRRDEVFVGISRAGIYKRYRNKFFAKIWRRSKAVQPSSPPTDCRE